MALAQQDKHTISELIVCQTQSTYLYTVSLCIMGTTASTCMQRADCCWQVLLSCMLCSD